MAFTLDGQRLKKNLAFIRKGFKVTPECFITRVSRDGQITYYRESDYRHTPVTVDFDQFRSKFGGWTESPLRRARALRLAREHQESIDYAHAPALVDNLIFDAARTLGADPQVLQSALDELLEQVRTNAHEEGYQQGYSQGEDAGWHFARSATTD